MGEANNYSNRPHNICDRDRLPDIPENQLEKLPPCESQAPIALRAIATDSSIPTAIFADNIFLPGRRFDVHSLSSKEVHELSFTC